MEAEHEVFDWYLNVLEGGEDTREIFEAYKKLSKEYKKL